MLINKNKPQWKYSISFEKVQEQLDSLNWEEAFIELYNMIQSLKKKLVAKKDNTFLEYIEDWESDMWVEDSSEKIGFGIIKNDDDWEELEYELNNLYDLFDLEKYVWCK